MDDAQRIILLGVNYRSAPLAVRETLSFDAEQAGILLRELASEEPGLEGAVLSTCNRTEFYLASQPSARAKEVLFGVLRRLRPQASILQSDCQRYEHVGTDAVRHLFRVVCGLDSAVLGDVQILHQVKECRNVAAISGTLGRQLHKAFDLALDLGKQARSETNISLGNASIGSAIAGMLTQHFGGKSRANYPRVVILGAGNVAASVARHLSKQRFGETCFVNRSVARAQRLAQLYGGHVCEWSNARSELLHADAIVATTSARRPVLTREMLEEVALQRHDKPPLVIDAGMPRNVEAGSSMNVLDIDHIRERHADILRTRQSAVPAVEEVIQKQLDAWTTWCNTLPLNAVVKSLYIDLEDYQRQTLRQLACHPRLCPEEFDRLIIRPMRRVLHHHVTRLRCMHSRSTTK